MHPALLDLLAKHKLTAPIRRELAVVPRVMDETAGLVKFIASDETLDCYQEIVRANGWQFTYFQKNAPFVDSHDYSTIKNLLGQVVDWQVENNQLVETVRYSQEPGTLGEWAFKMVRDGFLKAVSVGFIPVSMVSKWDGNSADFVSTIADLGLDGATAAKLSRVYLQQEQIELSQCVIGANPNALAKAYKAGCLTEHDLDKLCAMKARLETDNPAVDSAPAGKSSARTKLALLAQIQAQL
jgi:hypothetical protein